MTQILKKMNVKIEIWKDMTSNYFSRLKKEKEPKIILIRKSIKAIVVFDLLVLVSIFLVEIPLFTQELNRDFVIFLNNLNFIFLLLILITISIGIILYSYANKLNRVDINENKPRTKPI